MNPSQPPRVVLCALEFERERLERAGLGDAFELACCGPGAEGVTRWMDAHAGDLRPVALAGLAGGLSVETAVGSAYVIHVVRTTTGELLRPAWPLRTEGLALASVSCPKRTLTSPDAKRAWHREHGTDVVDLESEAFAKAAERAGRRWAIVRGVSDGVNDSLPDSIDTWVDEHGRTRRGLIALALLKQPSLVGVMQRLGKNAKLAMDAVAETLRRGAMAE